MHRSVRLPVALTLLALAGSLLAQEDKHRNARLEPGPVPQAHPPYQLLQFTERSRLSPVKTQCARMRTKPVPMDPDYDLTRESFFLVKPKAPLPEGERFGLFVHVSPSPQGMLPHAMLAVLAKHKLLFVSANHAGNARAVLHRMGLALDAVHNLKKRYDLDPNRVYVGGLSGGGRTSSMLGLLYPEVFNGAYPMIGVSYFRHIRVPGDAEKRAWASSIPPLRGAALERVREDSRFVLLTGETDYNQRETKVKFEQGFKKDSFRHVHYLEVPGMGHTAPPADWFEKGILLLDKPLLDARQRHQLAEQGLRDELARLKSLTADHPVKAYEGLTRFAKEHSHSPAGREAAALAKELLADEKTGATIRRVLFEEKARAKLSLARNYLAARRPDLATPVLRKIIDLYPGTPQAEEARKILAGIER